MSKKHEDVLILDIRSGSVGGGIVRFIDAEDHPQILYTTRISNYTTDRRDSESFTQHTLDLIERVIKKTKEEAPKALKKHGQTMKVNRITLVFSSPWYISQTQDIVLEKEKPFKFTKELFEKIADEKASIDDIPGQIIIEKDITFITLNGYSVTNPFTKKSTEVNASFFMSALPKDFKEKIDKLISQNTNVKTISYHSFPLIFFSNIRNLFPLVHNFMFLDIGAEVTDIGLVHGSRLQNTVSMPFGKNFFIRRLEKETGLNQEKVLAMLQPKGVVTADDVAFEKVVREIEAEWVEHFKKAVQSIVSATQVPRTFFAVVPRDMREALTKLLKSDQIKDTVTQASQKLNVIMVEENHTDHLYSYNDRVQHDIFISNETIFLQNYTEL